MSHIRNETYRSAMHSSVELGRALQRVLWPDVLSQSSFGIEFLFFYILFLRAERSLASIRSLVRLGLTEDAMALVRVMVENVITAEYLLLVGSDASEDFMQFIAISEWRDYQALLKSGSSLLPGYTQGQLKALEAGYNKASSKIMPDGSVKKRYGRGHDWTELSLSKRAEKVDALLKLRKSSGTAEVVFDVGFRKSSAYLHSSFKSIAQRMDKLERNDEVAPRTGFVEVDIYIRNRSGDPQLGLNALGAANVAASQMLVFMAEIFQLEKSRKWVQKFATRMFPSNLTEASRPSPRAPR